MVGCSEIKTDPEVYSREFIEVMIKNSYAQGFLSGQITTNAIIIGKPYHTLRESYSIDSVTMFKFYGLN